MTVAAPPVVREASSTGSANGREMSRSEVATFLKSRSEVTQAARKQIVTSIRRNVGNVHGMERQAKLAEILDEIATDPRLAGTRKAIRHYTALEAETARPSRGEAKPGRPDRKARLGVGPVSLATINLSGLSRTIAANAPQGIKSGSAEAQFFRNAIKDVGILGTAPFVGGFHMAKANVQDFVAPLRGDDLIDTLLHGESAQIYKGMAEGIKEEVTHPVKSFREHPLLTVLDVSGAASLAGRGAGAAARGLGKRDEPGVRGALDEKSHVVRPPLAMVDDGGQPVLVERTFSKDLTRRAAQSKSDRGREPLLDADGKPVTVTSRGREVPVLKASEAERDRYFKRRGDMVASRTSLGERKVREGAGKASKVRGVRGRTAKDIVAMITEGTVLTAKTFERDLRGHRAKVAAAIKRHEDGTDPYRHQGELESARARLALIDRVLGDPKAMAQVERIVAEGERHGARLNEGDVASAEAKILDPDAAKRSALSVTALEHMGARHFTVEEHAALEKAARQAETAAVEKYNAAKTPAERQTALDELNTARENRIAVSGRESEGVRAHESAQVAHRAAQSRLKKAVEKERKAGERVRQLAASYRAERGREGHNQQIAAYYVGDRRFDLRRDAVEYAKANSIHPREIRRVATTAGEAKRVGELSKARRALAAAKQQRREAQKAVKATERGTRQNPLPEANAALRYGEDNPFGKKAGEFLSNKDIEDFLRSQGRDPSTVAYLTHRHDIRGARAHHTQFRPGTRPVLDSGPTRTGSAYLKGVTESSANLLRDMGVRQATQLHKAKSLDRLVEEHGLRHPAWAKAQKGDTLTPGEQRIVDKGGLFFADEALELAQRLENDTGQRFTPMRAYQAKLPDDVKDVIREDYQGPGGMTTISQRLLNDRIIRPGDVPDKRARNVVLVPTELIERLDAHLRPAGTIEKFFQYVNKPFRMAVLPQPRWLTGNFGEAYVIRLPMVGSGINVPGLLMDLNAQKQALKALDNGTPEMRRAAEEIRAQQLGSGLFVGGKAGTVHRTAEEAMPEWAQRHYGRMVAKMPAVKTMTELTRSAVHWIAMPLHAFFWMNLKLIEAPAQKAAFGHSFRRDLQAITGSWTKSVISARQAVEDAAKGLVGTPAQERFMRDQYELLGKYAGFNPTLRAFVQSVAPFLPWALNATRFVYWTMPAHHTVKTALLIKAAEVVQQDWEEIHKNTPPGGLRDAIPTADGGWIDLARYTPWGLTAPIARGGDFRALTGQFTPQFGGTMNALQGKDPFGRPLKMQPTPANPKGKPSVTDMAWIAGYDLLEATVPYLSTARRLREKGETGYSDSTVISPKTKPGTSHGMSAIRRTFDPFRPTYLGAAGGERVVNPKPDRFQKARDQALEDELLDNLEQSSGVTDAEQQALEDELLENLYGG